jgi:hypothetical protein
MNERMIELAEQAGFSFKYKTAPDELNPGHTRQDLEKFAELIVRECVDIISPYAIRMENFDGGHPIAEIKQHFGVEE